MLLYIWCYFLVLLYVWSYFLVLLYVWCYFLVLLYVWCYFLVLLLRVVLFLSVLRVVLFLSVTSICDVTSMSCVYHSRLNNSPLFLGGEARGKCFLVSVLLLKKEKSSLPVPGFEMRWKSASKSGSKS